MILHGNSVLSSAFRSFANMEALKSGTTNGEKLRLWEINSGWGSINVLALTQHSNHHCWSSYILSYSTIYSSHWAQANNLKYFTARENSTRTIKLTWEMILNLLLLLDLDYFEKLLQNTMNGILSYDRPIAWSDEFPCPVHHCQN